MLWNTVLNAGLLYLFIVITLRLLGKKEIGQLSITDLVFVMLISEAVGDVMRASEDTLFGAVIAVLTIIIINKVLEFLLFRFKSFDQLMEGYPSVLIRHGKPNQKEMKKNKISIEDLEQFGREHGKGDISEIELMILEVDGKITLLDNADIKSSIRMEE